jgi:hypothetical protein
MAPATTSPAPNQPPYAAIKLLKGAFVLINRLDASQKSTVPFQYNPETLTRSLTPRYYQSQGDRFTGPAAQSIDITARLEASDNGGTGPYGILPQLAALELMINPTSSDLATYSRNVKSNKLQAVPPLAPRVLFVWGPSRVLPVRLNSMSVTETMFNNNLTPTIADVAVKMEIYPFEEATDADFQYIVNNLKNLERQQGQLVTAGVQIGVNPAGLT